MQQVIPRFIGVVLLAASGLKLHGLGVAPVSAMGWFSSAWFQAALIVAEVGLGLWLLSGVAPIGAWTLAVGAFGGFAAFASFQGVAGSSSCGCFGSLSVNPWYAFFLDVMVLVGLAFGRPDLKPLKENPARVLKPALSSVGLTMLGLVFFAGLLLGIAQALFGSAPAAIAYFRGERISIEPSVVEVGNGAAGETRTVTVTLRNWTNQPVKVFGGTANCSCTVLGDLPVTIPSNESRAVEVQVHFKGSPGIFTRRASFHVDDAGFNKLPFVITGEIHGAPGEKH